MEKEKFIEKEEKEIIIDKKPNLKETEESRKLVSYTSSSSSSSPSTLLPTSTYSTSHEMNESVDSKSFYDKIDINRKKKNGSKIRINGNDDVADNFTSDVRNLRVQGLSDDGKLLIIGSVDWKWQQEGHFIDINNNENHMRNDKKEGKVSVESNGGTKERNNGREQDRLSISREKKQEKEEERTSFMSPYLQGLTHICIHFMSYSTILNEVAANALSLPNITSLRLFNNDISTLKQVTYHFDFISFYFSLYY